MRKFILRLVVITALVLLTVLGLIGYKVYSLQDEIDELYQIRPEQTILCLGSSQLGCSFIEAPEFHNKVIWNSQKTPYTSLMRLKELEKRGQLRYIKKLVLYCNGQVLNQIVPAVVMLSVYTELPLSWKYLELFPVSICDEFCYIASNQRLPLGILIKEAVPANRPVVTNKGKKDFESFCENGIKFGKGMVFKDHVANWDSDLRKNYQEIKSICDQHGIKVVVVGFKMFSSVEKGLSPKMSAKLAAYQDFFVANGMEFVEVPQLPDSWYSDYVHLNERGARQFSEWLSSRLQR